MSAGPIQERFRSAAQGWEEFWFRPQLPHTLGVIRILAGSMLFYTHLVWGIEFQAFLGVDGWLPPELSREMHRGSFAFSYLWFVHSNGLLWLVHGLALLILALFTLGFYTRVTSILAWIITISYCQRLTGAFFGLDQVNAMLVMYLMLAPCGAVYSIDSWRAGRQGRALSQSKVSTNVSMRLIQIHLCVIYLFGGISKMRGEMWWDGSAVWYSIANPEYQSIDVTWLGQFPLLIALLTHTTIFWETFYCVLIWPRQTRPLMLLMAVAVHGGIACFLGMITFGTAMLIANLAFLSPSTTQRLVEAGLSYLPAAGRNMQPAVGRPVRTVQRKPR